jgi:hypothetical protein
MLARFAFWPLACVGARAASPGYWLLITFFLVLASLAGSSLLGSPRRPLGRAGVAVVGIVTAVPAVLVARAAAATLGPVAPVATLLVAAGATLAFARVLVLSRVRVEPSLDADALVLAPAAAWLLSCALLVRFGAEAVHAHVIVPALGTGIAVLACALGALAAAVLVRLRAWTARVYRGKAQPLAIAPAAFASPLLSHVEGADAAIVVAGDALDPYREHPPVVARVPLHPEPLLRRYTTRALAAVAVFVAAVAALALGAHAAASHPTDGASPRPLPLAGRCAVAPPRLRFVPLAPLTLVDASELADRYRRLGIEAREEAPLEGVERFRDLQRGQLAAEDLVDAARAERAAPGTNELVVVVTDADLYIRGNAWRYAFAYADGRVAVVSLARMDPAFPWVSPQPYAPRRPACNVELRARAFKMITRQLLLTTCGLPRTSARHSVRGAQVLSLADLDAIDETEL